MKNFKIVQHPTLGTKAVREGGWSWLAFLFAPWYFLFVGLKHHFLFSLIVLMFANISLPLGLTEAIAENLKWERSKMLSKSRIESKTYSTATELNNFIGDDFTFNFFWSVEKLCGHLNKQLGGVMLSINLVVFLYGGFLGNQSRYKKLLLRGFECVKDFEASNSQHAIALFEKSKQTS